jgi:hypothetical protein
VKEAALVKEVKELPLEIEVPSNTPAYISIRQHTPFVSIRQHTSEAATEAELVKEALHIVPVDVDVPKAKGREIELVKEVFDTPIVSEARAQEAAEEEDCSPRSPSSSSSNTPPPPSPAKEAELVKEVALELEVAREAQVVVVLVDRNAGVEEDVGGGVGRAGEVEVGVGREGVVQRVAEAGCGAWCVYTTPCGAQFGEEKEEEREEEEEEEVERGRRVVETWEHPVISKSQQQQQLEQEEEEEEEEEQEVETLETPIRASTIVLDVTEDEDRAIGHGHQGDQGGDQKAETDFFSPDVGPGVRLCVPRRGSSREGEGGGGGGLLAEEEKEEEEESEEGACEV